MSPSWWARWERFGIVWEKSTLVCWAWKHAIVKRCVIYFANLRHYWTWKKATVCDGASGIGKHTDNKSEFVRHNQQRIVIANLPSPLYASILKKEWCAGLMVMAMNLDRKLYKDICLWLPKEEAIDWNAHSRAPSTLAFDERTESVLMLIEIKTEWDLCPRICHCDKRLPRVKRCKAWFWVWLVVGGKHFQWVWQTNFRVETNKFRKISIKNNWKRNKWYPNYLL